MRLGHRGVLVGLAVVSYTLLFVACGTSDDSIKEPTPDGGKSSSSSGASGTSGTSGASSGSSTSSTSSSGSSGDDDGGNITDGGADADADAAVDAGPAIGDGGLGAYCNEDSQCGDKVCSGSHTCVTAVSCRGSTGTTAGVDTCGTAAAPESCCETLTLPTTTTRTLDKYEITAGRIRAFIEDVKKQNNGVPNLRKFARDYAAAHPTSQLGTVAANYPAANGFDAYIDLLPNDGATDSESPLPIWLGAFPADAMNAEDGCYLQPAAYGAATYWQDPATLETYDIGYTVDPNDPQMRYDGVRKFPASVLDKKPQNCTPPIILAAFCAWDGGELAEASDYHEVYGTNKFVLPNANDDAGATVYLPWTAVVPWGHFDWRNGHDGVCPTGWPECVQGNVPVFFASPTNPAPQDDDAPEIGEPGRFPDDVTKAKSPDGGGWYDIGGNLLEAAWPDAVKLPLPATRDQFCDTAAGLGPTAATQCNRNQSAKDQRPGTLRFMGDVPAIALIGYSFEIHAEYGQNYFKDPTPTATTEVTDLAPYAFPAHFQYGKVGGRCARVKK